MSKEYFRRKEMFTGEFRCLNCGKLLIHNVKGTCYEIDLKCSRCKCQIIVKCNEVIPFSMNSREILRSTLKGLTEIKLDSCQDILNKLRDLYLELES